jgi:hypothetical protein
MSDAHKNFAYSLVATAPTTPTAGTQLVVTAGQGALFPAVPFNATIWPTAAQPLASNAEIVQVTAVATDTLTIVRQQEGTSARTIVIGDQIAATITAGVLDDMETPLAPATGMTVQPGHGLLIPQQFEIIAGQILEIGLGAIMEIT